LKHTKRHIAFHSVLRKACADPIVRKLYMIISLSILFVTTCYWTILGAYVQGGNADQLANTYLLESSTTFTNALLPSQHTFFLKWPVFMLINLFGSTSLAFIMATLAITLLTVGALAFIMYRIDKRPLVFGTICLALASVLLLTPIQSYPAALLPVNMAMVTTRNLEYIFFIVGLSLLVKSKSFKSWEFVGSSALLALLITSDKLFLTVSVGGALLATLFYALFRKWHIVALTVRWLFASCIGAVLAMIGMWAMNTLHVVHVAGSTTGPYALISSVKELIRGVVYMILSLLTLFGANPVADTRVLGHWLAQVLAGFAHPHTLGFIINALIACAGLAATSRLIILSARHDKRKSHHVDVAAAPLLALLLVSSTVVACGAFIVSAHYYPVDARYVGIAVFTLFIALAAYTRQHHFRRPELVLVTGLVLFVGVLIGTVTATQGYFDDKDASHAIEERNSFVVQALNQHPVDVLVGDYWRVFPIKLKSRVSQAVTPLDACAHNRDLLSSTTWQESLHKHSFAYLLSLDKGLTDYPPCTLNEVTKHYGSPNASVIVSGSVKHPKELLLFYDQRGKKSSSVKTKVNSAPSTVIPIAVKDVPNVECPNDLTIMNVVAHQDDDLLFMNPDLARDIKDGHCVRTIYMTAGDAGVGKYYWLGRERGSQVAYNVMTGLDVETVWVQRVVELPDGQFITIASPKENPKVSLVFMHLPDGGIQGEGFASSHNESLARLEADRIPLLHTVESQSAYTSEQLTSALAILMQTYHPREVRTLASIIDSQYDDHSDHMAVGRYTQRAYEDYIHGSGAVFEVSPLVSYLGYPIRHYPINVSGEEFFEKERIFFAYAQHDSGVCGTAAQCAQGSIYSSYLDRQYRQ